MANHRQVEYNEPELRQIEISPQHGLSRLSLFSQPMTVSGLRVLSIEQLFQSCNLAQNNVFEGLQGFWDARSQVVNAPPLIREEIDQYFKSRQVEPNPNFILYAKRIMTSAVLTVLFDKTTDFSKVFYHLADELREGNYDVQFVEVTNSHSERVWSSGHQPGHVVAYREFGGMNLYGEIITEVYHFFFRHDPEYKSIFDNLPLVSDLLTKNVLAAVSYRKTAVILSDSTYRKVCEVEGGDVFYQPGITCGEMAAAIKSKFCNLTNYKFVIIAVGTNDATRRDMGTVAKWEQSWSELKEVLMPLKNHPHTNVIMNSGIGVVGWDDPSNGQPRVPEYCQWFRARYLEAFADAPNFHPVDWSVPGSKNFFMNDHRHPVMGYMDHDKKHPNVNGTRRMWRFPCRHLGGAADDLKSVRIFTTSKNYSVQTIQQRQYLF